MLRLPLSELDISNKQKGSRNIYEVINTIIWSNKHIESLTFFKWKIYILFVHETFIEISQVHGHKENLIKSLRNNERVHF